MARRVRGGTGGAHTICTTHLQFGGAPTEEVLVLPTKLCVAINCYAPSNAVTFSFWAESASGAAGDVTASETEAGGGKFREAERIDVAMTPALYLTVATISRNVNDKKVTFRFFDSSGSCVREAELRLTVLKLNLDVDADRDGVVEEDSPHKNTWWCGDADSRGAILLYNCDVDETHVTSESARRHQHTDHQDDIINGPEDLKDMAPMMLRTDGPEELPENYSLELFVDHRKAPYVGIFDVTAGLLQGEVNKFVVGPGKHVAEVWYPGSLGEIRYAVEARSFPSQHFDGFVNVHVALFKDGVPVYEDSVLFRVAPWLMTPNTLAPKTVFVCATHENQRFLNHLRRVISGVGQTVHLEVAAQNMYRGDCWIQVQCQSHFLQLKKT